MKLHLGVVDIPYAEPPAAVPKVAQAKRGKANKPIQPPSAGSTQTTGGVAEILEGKYAVMGTFAEHHGDENAAALEDSMAGALENLMAGAPPTNNPFGTAEMKIEDGFRQFLDLREMNGQPGVPTQAALDGVNHRMAHPYAKRPSRPSFIDTGLYQSSAKAWVEQE